MPLHFIQLFKFLCDTFQKDETPSSKKSTLSPVDHYRHSNHHRRGSSRTLSPSPSQSRHSTTHRAKHSSSPKVNFQSFSTPIEF